MWQICHEGRDLDGHGHACGGLLHPPGRALRELSVLADCGAHAAFGHAVRTRKTALDEVHAGGFEPSHQGLPVLLLLAHDARPNHLARVCLLQLTNVLLHLVDVSLRDKVDVLQADHFLVLEVEPGHHGVDQFNNFFFHRCSLEHRRRPSGVECPCHHLRIVSAWRGCQRKRVLELDPCELDRKIHRHSDPSI